MGKPIKADKIATDIAKKNNLKMVLLITVDDNDYANISAAGEDTDRAAALLSAVCAAIWPRQAVSANKYPC